MEAKRSGIRIVVVTVEDDRIPADSVQLKMIASSPDVSHCDHWTFIVWILGSTRFAQRLGASKSNHQPILPELTPIKISYNNLLFDSIHHI